MTDMSDLEKIQCEIEDFMNKNKIVSFEWSSVMGLSEFKVIKTRRD